MRKQIAFLTVLALAVSVFAGCAKTPEDLPKASSAVISESKEEKNPDPVPEKDDAVTKTEGTALAEESSFEEILTGYCAGDYMVLDPDDLFEAADLVVRASLGEALDVFVGPAFFPMTRSRFEVKEVYKGSCGGTVEASYYDGVISLYEYRQNIPEGMAEKRGYNNYTDEEAQKIGVTMVNFEAQVTFDDSDYLLFLSYDPDLECYIVIADAYAACKISNGQFYNQMEEKYEEIAFPSEDSAF